MEESFRKQENNIGHSEGSAKYILESMLDVITNENQHHILLEDTPQGVEEW